MRDEKAWKWLNENELSYNIWDKKYRYNNESFDEWLDRVSGKNPRIKKLIYEKKFIFGGRTLANRGTTKGSYSNCYSIGYVPDSLDGIMDVASKIAMTFKAQGGQGLSLSKIRPKGSSIHGQFVSDGIVPFMEIFNTVTDSISQGGSRKGALMMSLDINHPEAETFMTIKSDLQKINKANLSLEIDDDFMKSLESENESFNSKNQLKFKLLAEQACKYAEPGVLFTNRLRNYNLMEFVDDYIIETTNPCGEQPLPKHGACNLSSINISEYVKNPFTSDAYIDFETLENDSYSIVEAMDDVLEENADNHALQEQRDCARKWRNIGIGIMGLHDAFIKLGIVYGSKESIFHTQEIMKNLFRFAVISSVDLAQTTRGNFPGYSEKIWDASILKYAFNADEIENFRKINHLRNCAVLSIAPTGSIGTMWNVSTGVEPWFNVHFTRNTKSLDGKETSYKVYAPVVQQAMDKNWHPETYVSANDIPWKQHIDIQAVCQKYVDSSISKTINMSKETTSKEIEDLYLYAWVKGLKGCTIFVDGSRDPILSNSTTEEQKSLESSENSVKIDSISRGDIVKAGDDCVGLKRTLMTGCGTLHCSAFFDPKNGNLLETYLSKGSTGGCNNFMIGLSRMISLAARGGITVDKIVDQLKSCGSCPSYAVRKATKGDVSPGSCCPVAIGNALVSMNCEMQMKLINQFTNNAPLDEVIDQMLQKADQVKDKCPECGAPLEHSSGCMSCPSCGYSKCG